MNWRVHVFTPAVRESRVPTADHHYYARFNASEFDCEPVLSEWSVTSRRFLEHHLRKIPQVKSIDWHLITMDNYQSQVEHLVQLQRHSKDAVVIFNVIDGQSEEEDGWPGIVVVKAVHDSGLCYTGADPTFYSMDVSKANTKAVLLEKCREFTPGAVDLSGHRENEQDLYQQMAKLQMPVLIKPARSSGSRGITEKSVVHSVDEAMAMAKTMDEFGGAYAEEYIVGTEYTCLTTGDASVGIKTYRCAQRTFRSDVPPTESFLSFNMKWESWSAQPNEGKWWYESIKDSELNLRIQKTAEEVYRRIGGRGYCRMDIRVSSSTGRIYVVDVNANCSIDSDEESSLAYIMRGEGVAYDYLLSDILQYAVNRRGSRLISNLDASETSSAASSPAEPSVDIREQHGPQHAMIIA